jgi:predicted DNA-binding transcriptional regulator AlpA
VKSASMQSAGQERMTFLFEAHAKGLPMNIRVQDVAALTGLSVSTLNLLRLKGGGPRFMRFGRSVRYKLAEVIHWMNRADYASTSEADAAKRSKPCTEAAS